MCGALSLSSPITPSRTTPTPVIVVYAPFAAPLRGIRRQNPNHVEFDLLRSFKIICDGAVGNIYAFLIMFNSNIWPNCIPLRDIRLQYLSEL